jgi:hypothetical protein
MTGTSAAETNWLSAWGGNGDYYIAVVPEGEGTVGRAARISMSGGAARVNPALVRAISDAYRALLKQ